MGMLADYAEGLNPTQLEELARRQMGESPEPIPMWDENNPDPGPSPVQKNDTYTDNVQASGMFDEFEYADVAAEGQDEDPAVAQVSSQDGSTEEEPGLFDEFEYAETPPLEVEAPLEAEGDEPGAEDYGRVLMGGLAQTGGMVAGAGEYLSNMVGADTVKDFFGTIRKAATSAADYWHSGLSKAGKRDLEKKYATTGGEAAWKDLDSVMFTIIASAPSTVVTMGPAGIAARAAYAAKIGAGSSTAVASAAAARAAALTGAAAEGTLGAGGIASDITTTLENMSDEELHKLEAWNKLKGEYPGMSDEDLKLGVIANATRWNAAIGGVITGAVGAAAGPIEARIFTSDMGFGKRMLTGALSEGVQEGLQSPTEAAMTNLGTEAELTEGLLEATLAGIVGGAGAGGPMAAFGGGGTAAEDTQATDALDAGIDQILDSETPEADAQAEAEFQAAEAEGRVADIEDIQNETRAEVEAAGGDMLDQELAAAGVADPLMEQDNAIKSHLKRMQNRIDAEVKVNAEQDKLAAEREKEVLANKDETAAAVEKSKKATEEDAMYAEKEDSNLRIGQKTNKNMGHITEKYEGPLNDKQAAAVEKAAAPETGNQMAEAFKKAANVAATSPTNDQPAPTPKQIEQGNYRKGHARLHGLEVTIENPAGSTREAADGSWKQKMNDHYGYIRGTESAEGPTEQLDVFVGEDHESDRVTVIDQINKDGTFDEHKVMLNYPNAVAARRAYASNYPKGFKVGKMTTMSTAEFKKWLIEGDQTQPIQTPKNAGTSSANVAGPAKEVIQTKTRKGGRGARPEALGEAAEESLTDTRNSRKSIRYRLEDDVNDRIKTIAPAEVMEELDYLVEGFEEEDAGNYKLAVEDAIDQAEDQGNKKMLNKLRAVGIDIGMYRVIEQEEIDRTSTTRGKVWDFTKNGKKYVYDTNYKTEMQKAASETLDTEDSGLENTKIVDEKGVPLVVYRGVHGEAEGKTLKGRMPTFTPNKYIAGDYAADGEYARVGSYRLNITNPVDLDTGEDVISMKDLRALIGDMTPAEQKLFNKMMLEPQNWRGFENSARVGELTQDDIDAGIPDNVYTDSFEIADSLEFVELMKNRGHDGIIIRGPFQANDEMDVIPADMYEDLEVNGEVEYRPFSEDQIITEMDKVKGSRTTKKGLRYRLEDKVNAKELVGDIKKDGDGFTVDNTTGKKKKSGFAAGIGKEKVFEGRTATMKEVNAYREEHAEALAEKDNYLGAWMDGGNMFLDVSKVYPNTDMGKKRAYEAAKSRGEFGIQDLSKPAEEGYIPIEYKEGEMDAARGIKDGDKYFDKQAFKDVGPRFNSRTTLTYMSPDDFLKMAERLRFPNEQKAREVKELADEGTPYNSLPFLSFDNEGSYGQTVQHEGRHRAMELKSRGVKSMPVRLTSGEQGSASSFRWDDDDLTLPKTLKGQSGNEIPFPKDARAKPVTPVADVKDGRDFRNFFSAVTKGLTGTSSTGAKYTPVISSVAEQMQQKGSPVGIYSIEYIKHRGKFDDHIAFSIPGYKEVQQAVGSAIASTYGKGDTLLDIGASEGSFAKAITAISGMSTTSLDPNPDMQDSFNDVSTVPGAEYSMSALGTAEQEGQLAWMEREDEANPVEVPFFDPMGQTYDVVHEAMVFQFVSNERQGQIKRVKELLSADGVFITEEKFHTARSAANEAKKNRDHKAKYFEKKDLDAKSAEVLEGMHKNMVNDVEFGKMLSEQFNYVVQFWDSGNFKGYAASDSKEAITKLIDAMPDLNSEFSTVETPVNVSAGLTALTAWFGDSQVTDENGDPLEVYHGTDAEFDTFMANEPATFVEGMTDRKGIYFSGDAAKASSYARGGMRRPKGGAAPRVIRAFLKMENPLNITGMIAAGQKAGLSFGNAKREAMDALTPEHDGVIFDGDAMNEAEYVVFEPTQVKASNNTTWDAKSGKFRQRLGATESTEAINRVWAKEALKPIIDKMPGLEPVILGNPSEAPKAMYEQMMKDGALKAKGVFDTETGRLYIFSENHNSKEDLVRTLMHEGVAHKGLRILLKDNFDPVMLDVFNNGDQKLIRNIAKKYDLDLTNVEDQIEAAEEYVASIAENDVQSGILQKVVAAVRQALRDLGIVREWSEADIKGLLRRSMKKLKGKPMRKAMIKKSFIVAETGEIVDIETSADVELRNIEKRKAACEELRKCVR